MIDVFSTIKYNDRLSYPEIESSAKSYLGEYGYSPSETQKFISNTPSYKTILKKATSNSSYIKDTSKKYMNNSLKYLLNIRPKKVLLYEYIFKENKNNSFEKLDFYNLRHDNDLISKDYTNDFSKTKEYKELEHTILNHINEIGNKDIFKSPDLLSKLLELFSISKNNVNPYKKGTLENKLFEYKKDGEKSDFEKFLNKNGFNFINKGFSIDSNKRDNNSLFLKNTNYYELLNIKEKSLNQKKETNSKFIDFNLDIDTYDYMAGAELYCAFRDPLVMGKKPIQTLESESFIYGGSELIEKRFNLLKNLNYNLNNEVAGLSVWRDIDIINKVKYLSQVTIYNNSVKDINKTNEMLAIFANKLDFIIIGNFLANDVLGYLSYGYIDPNSTFTKIKNGRKTTEPNMFIYDDFSKVVKDTAEGIKNNETIDWINDSESTISNKFYNEIKELIYIHKQTGERYYKNKYATYKNYGGIGYPEYVHQAIAVMNAGLNKLKNETTSYQNELIEWAKYMDNNYGIEV